VATVERTHEVLNQSQPLEDFNAFLKLHQIRLNVLNRHIIHRPHASLDEARNSLRSAVVITMHPQANPRQTRPKGKRRNILRLEKLRLDRPNPRHTLTPFPQAVRAVPRTPVSGPL
jgi:hypothetical protein